MKKNSGLKMNRLLVSILLVSSVFTQADPDISGQVQNPFLAVEDSSFYVTFSDLYIDDTDNCGGVCSGFELWSFSFQNCPNTQNYDCEIISNDSLLITPAPNYFNANCTDIILTFINFQISDPDENVSSLFSLRTCIQGMPDPFEVQEIATQIPIYEDDTLSFEFAFTDPDLEPASNFSIELDGDAAAVNGGWLEFDGEISVDGSLYSQIITGIPGEYNFYDDNLVISLSDTAGNEFEENINFTILSVNDGGPVIQIPTDGLPMGFGGANYQTTIYFTDADEHAPEDYEASLSNVTIDGMSADDVLSIGEIFEDDGLYSISVSGSFPASDVFASCQFDLTITDEIIANESQPEISLTDVANFTIGIRENQPPEAAFQADAYSGFPGELITLDASSSTDPNNDSLSYFWSVNPIKQSESWIDVDMNSLFTDYDILFDLNNNGVFDSSFSIMVQPELEGFTSEEAQLIMPSVNFKSTIEVILTVYDLKGASDQSSQWIELKNPTLTLENMVGEQDSIIAIPVSITDLNEMDIESIDIEFKWNTIPIPVDDPAGCLSVAHYPPVISSMGNVELNLELLGSTDYFINNQEAGRLSMTIYMNGNEFLPITNNLEFANLDVGINGYHAETDKIHISRFEINEIPYAPNSLMDSGSGHVSIAGPKEFPVSHFVIKDNDDNVLVDNLNNSTYTLYSGTELSFEITTYCDDTGIPAAGCTEAGHFLIGNGANPEYNLFFDDDAIGDQTGSLLGIVLPIEYSYSVLGFEIQQFNPTLKISSAYGCDSLQSTLNVQPLIPTMSFEPFGEPFTGLPISKPLSINQVEDMASFDFSIAFDGYAVDMVNVVSLLDSLPGFGDENSDYNYNLLYNINDLYDSFIDCNLGEAFIDCGTDSEENTICSNEPGWNDIYGNGIYDDGEEFFDCDLDNLGNYICEGEVGWSSELGNGVFDGEGTICEGYPNWHDQLGNGIYDDGEIEFNRSLDITLYSVADYNKTFFDSNNPENETSILKIEYFALLPEATAMEILSFEINEIEYLSNLQKTVMHLDFTTESLMCGEDQESSGFLDECGVCSGGDTGLLPNSSMDCDGTCNPDDPISVENECLTSGYNVDEGNCKIFMGYGSSHPNNENNGFDLCGECGGNNIEYPPESGNYIGSAIDCQGNCHPDTPNGTDNWGGCGCMEGIEYDDYGLEITGVNIFPDVNGNCRDNFEDPDIVESVLEESGLCAEPFEDTNQNGRYDESDSFTENDDLNGDGSFTQWGFKNLNYDPNAQYEDGSCSSGLIVNEFFIQPSTGTSVPDYIELLNMTPFDINLLGFVFIIKTGEDQYDIFPVTDDIVSYPPVIKAGRHFLVSTGMPFYNAQGNQFFPGQCNDNGICDGLPEGIEDDFCCNSITLANLNLGSNSGEFLITVGSDTIDHIIYTQEAYWPVGASQFHGRSLELITPYNSRELSSNWESGNVNNQNKYMYTEDGIIINYGTPNLKNYAYDLDITNQIATSYGYDCATVNGEDNHGLFNGLASEDICGECSGGTSGLIVSRYDEELGFCVGDPNYIDCACTCNPIDNAIVDECGVCTGGLAGSYAYSGPEEYEDSNNNNIYDEEEPFIDLNGNDLWDDNITINGGIILPANLQENAELLTCNSSSDCEIWNMVCSDNFCSNENAEPGYGTMDLCNTCRTGPECTPGSDTTLCDPFYNIAEEYDDLDSNGFYNFGETFLDLNGDGFWNSGQDDCGLCVQGEIELGTDLGYLEIDNFQYDSLAVDTITNSYNDTNGDGIISSCFDGDCPDWENFTIGDNYSNPLYGTCLVDCLEDIDDDEVDELIGLVDDCGFCQDCTQYGYECSENPYWNNSCITGLSSEIDMNSLIINLNWDELQSALAYNLYKDNELLAMEIEEFSFVDSNVVYPESYCYYVEGILEFAEIFYDCNDDFTICQDDLEWDPDTMGNGVWDEGEWLDDSNGNGIWDEGEYSLPSIQECTGLLYYGEMSLQNFDAQDSIKFFEILLDISHELDTVKVIFNDNISIDELEDAGYQLSPGPWVIELTENSFTAYPAPNQAVVIDTGSNVLVGVDFTLLDNSNSLCISDSSKFHSNQTDPGFNPFIIQLPECVYFGCTDSLAFNFDSTATVNDGSCFIPYYNVEIEESGYYQSFIFSPEIDSILYDDQIGIFDYGGFALDTNGNIVNDTVLVGSGRFMGDSLTINAIRGNSFAGFQGYQMGNPVIIKLWRESIEYEFNLIPEDSLFFGTSDVFISEALLDITDSPMLALPEKFELYPVYPNPFNPIATIKYDVPEYSHVLIDVFNVLGKRVTRLQNGYQQPGVHLLNWDATGKASGMYIIRMSAGRKAFVQKMMLLK